MKETLPVDILFPEETWNGGDIREFIETQQGLGLVYPNTPSAKPNGYLFRGELDYMRPLESTLERAARRHEKLPRSGDLDGAIIKSVERKIIQDFMQHGGRRITDSLNNMSMERWGIVKGVFAEAGIEIPDRVSQDPRIVDSHPDNEIFWWLAVMQHYGHATRLVDFSTDFITSLFMAVQQFRGCSSLANIQSTDLIIYCFPCRDAGDHDQNKTPFKPPVDMNEAMGFEIGLPDFTGVPSTRKAQKWGWDRPYFQTPRLWVQKGMFVYPFDQLESPLRGEHESWLARNLLQNKGDPFFTNAMGKQQRQFGPKRIRIPRNQVARLTEFLETECGLSRAAIYLDYTHYGRD